LICVLPLIGVFYKSLTSNIHFFTLKNYYSLFNPNIKDFIGLTATEMIVNSIIFAIIVAFLSIILALLFNYGLHYKSTKTGNPIIGIHYLTNIIVILPLMVSAITLIYSIFSLYRDTAIFDQVSIVIIISHVLIAFPFVNRIIATARVNLNQDMLDVGRSLGLNRFKVFLKIELPIIFSSLLVAGFFSFAISIGEFASTNFIARGNTATIPIGIYRLVETRHIGEASAYSSILILLTIFMFFIIEKVGKGIVDYKI
jgi:ABC-type Fe3+ transport system permease subunit